MFTRRNITILGILLIIGFYLYIAADSEPIEIEDYSFPPPAENAPLTQREIDIRNGEEVEPLPEALPPSYQDGTYESEALYLLPNRGQYRISVTMTLRDEVITSTIVRISPDSTNPEADVFVRNYRQEIIGKPIADAALSIEDAPLTSNAFNNTLRDIRQQAYR